MNEQKNNTYSKQEKHVEPVDTEETEDETKATPTTTGPKLTEKPVPPHSK